MVAGPNAGVNTLKCCTVPMAENGTVGVDRTYGCWKA